MAYPARANALPNEDFTFRDLVKQVVMGNPSAWRQFVEQFSKLVFSLVWRYANGNYDLSADLYLYVIQGLHQSNEEGETFFRLRRYLESVDKYDGTGRLSTWLGRVTQNLVSDYFREQEGRKTLPRSILRLNSISQQIFKLLYWDCLSEREAFETIKNQAPRMSRNEFDKIVTRINNCLKTCNRWAIYSEVIRRTPALPLYPFPADRHESPRQLQIADPSPESNPTAIAAAKQKQDAAKAVGILLRRLLEALPKESRLILVCRFKHSMTAGEIAKLLGRRDEKQIYTDIERLKDQLKGALDKEGVDFQKLEGGLDAIEGLLDEFDVRSSSQKIKSPM